MTSVILSRSLVANAVFSGVAGLALSIGAAPMSSWLQLPVWLTAAIGVGLLGFAVGVALVARHQHRVGILGVITADLGWILGAVVIILGFPSALSTSGQWALAAVTLVVAALAALQTIGFVHARRA